MFFALFFSICAKWTNLEWHKRSLLQILFHPISLLKYSELIISDLLLLIVGLLLL